MLKQIRTVKYPKIILQKALFKNVVAEHDANNKTNVVLLFENSTIQGDQGTLGCVKIKIHEIDFPQLSITYFTDTTPQQRVSFSQFKKDLEQLHVEVIQEYYNHYEVFIRAQIQRLNNPLYINVCIPHQGEVHYLYNQ